MSVQITYHGHACFVLSCGGYRVAVDPYDTSVTGYAPLSLEAEEVLCSHGHHDHNYSKAVKIRKNAGTSPFTVREFEIPHDDAGGRLRGMNLIRLFEAEGLRIAHFGDIGCELSPEYVEQLQGLDVMMAPVGGTYTIDAAQAEALRQQLQPRVFIPMHYRCGSCGYEVLQSLNEFLTAVRKAGTGVPVRQEHEHEVTITPGMEEQVLVMTWEK